MTRTFFAILLLTLSCFLANAQEILTAPSYNPVVAKHYEASKALKSTTATQPLTLPFFDDFSKLSVYPSTKLWADSDAFVNSDYAKFPPTVGVATLDALNKKGLLFPNAGPNPFDADNLTSLPIRLDSILQPIKKAITKADSLYLSFYYQPQGRAVSPPSSKSSLLLEFHSPGNNDTLIVAKDTTILPHWNQIWSTTGGVQVDSFALPNHQYFKQVMIPITDSAKYFKNGFQFRFRNIAALSGNSQPDWRNNGSNWNIDVVRLNTSRNIHDTIIKDVAFGDIAPSMLKDYESMPFRQYRKNFINEMKDSLDIAIANLDNVNENVWYKYNIRKNSGTPFAFYDKGNFTIKPYATYGYSDYNLFARPVVISPFPISNDQKVVFHIIHTLVGDPNPYPHSNDSIQFDQLFSNYYAYDNGTAEAGVGINGAAGSYAVQFKLNDKDTLRGIQIYFNPVVSGSNLKNIDLVVWNDMYGEPGQVIKTLGNITPMYSDIRNEFVSYMFDTLQVIDPVTFPGLIFYIGWSQSTVENVNIGFDRYKDSHAKRFFNVDGNWEMSSPINYGSVMMRPVVGMEDPLGIEKPKESTHLNIYPNPVCNGQLAIQLPNGFDSNNTHDLLVELFSTDGKCALRTAFSDPIQFGMLPVGLYMVVVTDQKNGKRATGKIIVK